MNIEDLWPWSFTKEPFEGCESLCPECTTWQPHAQWNETSVYCEDCGDHIALQCPVCDEAYDSVWGPEFDVRAPGGE